MSKHTAVRLLHDVGVATWFGGSLMGATGLNAAAALLDDPAERARISTAGWSRWAPVGAAGVLAHVVGAAGLTVTDAPRIGAQDGVARSSAVKAGLTVAGLGVTALSSVLNRKMAAAGPVPVRGATEPSADTPRDVASAQRQLKVVQWLNPLLAGAVIAAGSWQSEQQRAAQVAPGVVRRLAGQAPLVVPVVGVLAVAAVVLRRRGQASPAVEEYPTAPVVQRPAPDPGAVPSGNGQLGSKDASPRP